MVRRDLVASKVTRASGWLDSAEAAFAQSPATFVAEVNGRDLALFYLFPAVQECIDIAAHGYAMLDYLRVQREAQQGVPQLRVFLAAVSDAAGL